MATAKKGKGLIDQAIGSKPVKATKEVIGKAVGAATDAFMNPPLAPALPRKPTRRSTKAAKRSGGKSAAKSMDRKLVSAMEDYEVKYLAQKHKVPQKAVKEAVAKVGSSRNKVEAELKKGKV